MLTSAQAIVAEEIIAIIEDYFRPTYGHGDDLPTRESAGHDTMRHLEGDGLVRHIRWVFDLPEKS